MCNDGGTIAKAFDLKDPGENLGAQMLRQAAKKAGDNMGDGSGTPEGAGRTFGIAALGAVGAA